MTIIRKTIAFSVLVSALGAVAPSIAQQPSQAQVDAIRQACRADYMSHCAGVPAGGPEALQCLQQHAAGVSVSCRQALAAANPPATAAAPAVTTQQAATASWPHTISKDGASVTIYQPQAISWPNQQKLTARAAIAVTPPNQAKPFLGTIELALTTRIDNITKSVSLSDPQLLETHFPSLDTNRATSLAAKIRAALPTMQMPHVPLESVLLSLRQSPVAPVAVANDPPTIFFVSRPASLVVFDGDPVLAPVANTGLTFAVNTNWDMFVDHDTWYLLDNGMWLSAKTATGPYTRIERLPPAFDAIPNDANFAAVRKHIPAQSLKSADQIPLVFVSTKPAEIIVTAGPPQFTPVQGTGLQRVTNTPVTLFFDPSHGQFYLLLSGRWFSAPGLDGPWTYATDRLPPDFARISSNGPAAAVLASIPGTVQAQEAVLKAQIPRTATLKRDTATIAIAYVGPPRFEPIPGTPTQYAVNTRAVVLKIDDKYYACENAAWFEAPSPEGPWRLADSVPAAINTIPPSTPLYNVTYAQVYGATPTTVTYGYTAGYLMGFVSAGVLVYGTGYYYPPYVVRGPVPVFYPYPYTYAGSVWYSASNGAWGRGGTIYGPYGGAATGARYYNPATGAWAQGGAIYGPNGGVGGFSAYNPSTGSYAHGNASWSNGSGSANANFYNGRTSVSATTNQNWNPYGRWGSSMVSGANQTVSTRSSTKVNDSAGAFSSSTGAKGAGYHNRATGNSDGAVRTAGGDVYAGHDGNVYRHTDDGWSKWNNGGWNPMQPPRNNGQQPGRFGGSGLGAAEGGGWRATMDSSNFRQLEQDRLGREAGAGRFSAGGWGGVGRFRR